MKLTNNKIYTYANNVLAQFNNASEFQGESATDFSFDEN